VTTALEHHDLRRRDIRRSRWFEEVAEYFAVDPAVLERAAPARRLEAGEEPPAMRQARRELEERFMPSGSRALLERIRTAPPDTVTDGERSTSWRDYIFLCVNAERRAFERLGWYDGVIAAVVQPLLAARGRLTVVDYGCGSSLFTRLLVQDFGPCVIPVSVDVARYAVDFSVARNRLYNPAARGVLVEDVMAPLTLRDVDVILAYSVFEHLPNAEVQIQGLVDALAPGGVLVENYAGHSKATPHKSDTWSAYRSRDANLDRLRRQLVLLHGRLPERHDGAYGEHDGDRYWIKPGADAALVERLRRALRGQHSLWRRARRHLAGRLRAGATAAWQRMAGPVTPRTRRAERRSSA
jgi:SAM-dependent methyltransferase